MVPKAETGRHMNSARQQVSHHDDEAGLSQTYSFRATRSLARAPESAVGPTGAAGHHARGPSRVACRRRLEDRRQAHRSP